MKTFFKINSQTCNLLPGFCLSICLNEVQLFQVGKKGIHSHNYASFTKEKNEGQLTFPPFLWPQGKIRGSMILPHESQTEATPSPQSLMFTVQY